MTKQFWIILAVIAAVFVGIIVFSDNKKSDTTNKSSSTAGATEHIIGKSPEGVALVEYGDYQCPGCGAYYQTVKAVADKYKDQMTFQFINFPLTSSHPNAFAASRAAEAAGLQGKYWEMHDLLYQENQAYYSQQQPTWVPASDPMPFFQQYAQTIGLNMKKFNEDFKSSKVNTAINADMNKGNKAGVSYTPTFYLDGQKLDSSKLSDNNGPSVDKFSKLIDAELAKKKQDK